MIRDDSHTVSGSSAASEMPKSGLRVGRGEGRNGDGADPMSLTEATSTPITPTKSQPAGGPRPRMISELAPRRADATMNKPAPPGTNVNGEVGASTGGSWTLTVSPRGWRSDAVLAQEIAPTTVRSRTGMMTAASPRIAGMPSMPRR